MREGNAGSWFLRSAVVLLILLISGLQQDAALAQLRVRAWGDDRFGQLGDGRPLDFLQPVQVVSLSGVQSIASGGQYSLVLRNDGTVWVWGNGRSSPAQLGLTNVIAISGGGSHSLALRSDGTVWAW